MIEAVLFLLYERILSEIKIDRAIDAGSGGRCRIRFRSAVV
jgi:hypothetical protein